LYDKLLFGRARLHRLAEETAQLFRPSGQLPRLHDDNCFIIVKAQSCARAPFIEGSIQQFNDLCMALAIIFFAAFCKV
jgi:hypothetical protein